MGTICYDTTLGDKFFGHSKEWWSVAIDIYNTTPYNVQVDKKAIMDVFTTKYCTTGMHALAVLNFWKGKPKQAKFLLPED